MMPSSRKEAEYAELEVRAVKMDLAAEHKPAPAVRLHQCDLCGRVYDDKALRIAKAVCDCGAYPILPKPVGTAAMAGG